MLARISSLVGRLGRDVAPPPVEEARYPEPSVWVALVAGTITVRRGEGAEIIALVQRAGRDAERLRLVQYRTDERATLQVVCPVEHVTYPPLGPHAETTVPLCPDGSLGCELSDDGRTVRVVGQGAPVEAYADVEIILPDDRALELVLGAGRVRLEGVSGTIIVHAGSAEVRAEGCRGRLDIRSDTGDVKVRGLDGDVIVHADSGDVSLLNVTGGRIVATTETGALRGSALTATTVAMHSDQGALLLHGLAAYDVALTTGSGDLDVAVVGDPSVMSIRAKVGNVRLRLAPTLNALVTVASPFGTVTPLVPLANIATMPGGLSGQLGHGAGQIYCEAVSGDVVLERTEAAEPGGPEGRADASP